jgi:hypothetical protein
MLGETLAYREHDHITGTLRHKRAAEIAGNRNKAD